MSAMTLNDVFTYPRGTFNVGPRSNALCENCGNWQAAVEMMDIPMAWAAQTADISLEDPLVSGARMLAPVDISLEGPGIPDARILAPGNASEQCSLTSSAAIATR